MTVLRFAPSPNGELHLGHAYSALLNADLARQTGGQMLLRIEDIDLTRATPEFEAGIYRDLEWLGLDWERPVRRQSEHFAEYDAALARLKALGVVYPAFMSRGEVHAWVVEHEAMTGRSWPRDPDGSPHYPPVDRMLSDAERQKRMADSRLPGNWRLNVEAAVAVARNTLTSRGKLSWNEFDPASGVITTIEARPELWGDVVIARNDTPTSYHLSVVIDDALQGVTHVVRGMDLYAATGVHRLLQTLLDLPEPLYHHHRLILDADGRKLSKSAKSLALRALREAGKSPADIRTMVGL